MRYTWDKKILLRLWKNPETREEIGNIFKSYFGLLLFAQDIHMSAKDTLNDDVIFFNENEFLESILLNFAFQSNIKNLPDSYFIEKIKTQDEVMELTNSFYSSLDSDIYTEFEKLFAQRFTHFRFTSPINSSVFSGNTFYINTANETFMSAMFDKTLANVFSVIHEYGHAIWSNIRQDDYEEDVDNIFCEVESIFMELLAYDYIEKHYHQFKDDAKTARYNLYDNALIDMDTLLYKRDFSKDAIDLGDEFDHMNNRKILHFLKEKWELSYSDLSKIFQMPAYIISPYPMGTLIAIEIYLIYQKDPKEALKLFKDMMHIKFRTNQDFYEDIKKMGINPSSHISEYEKSLTLKR